MCLLTAAQDLDTQPVGVHCDYAVFEVLLKSMSTALESFRMNPGVLWPCTVQPGDHTIQLVTCTRCGEMPSSSRATKKNSTVFSDRNQDFTEILVLFTDTFAPLFFLPYLS